MFSNCGKCYKGNNRANVGEHDGGDEGNAMNLSHRMLKDAFVLHPERWQETIRQRSRKSQEKRKYNCKDWNERHSGKFEEEVFVAVH